MHAPFATESFKVTNKERCSLSLSGRIGTEVKEQDNKFLSKDEIRMMYKRYPFIAGLASNAVE